MQRWRDPIYSLKYHYYTNLPIYSNSLFWRRNMFGWSLYTDIAVHCHISWCKKMSFHYCLTNHFDQRIDQVCSHILSQWLQGILLSRWYKPDQLCSAYWKHCWLRISVAGLSRPKNTKADTSSWRKWGQTNWTLNKAPSKLNRTVVRFHQRINWMIRCFGTRSSI